MRTSQQSRCATILENCGSRPSSNGLAFKTLPVASPLPIPIPISPNSNMMSLAQVNISGLRAATDESRHRHRRLIWVFLLTACFAVMVAQITDRVRHFLSEPVSVQVRVERNSSLTYPAITLCNKNQFNMTAINLLKSKYGLDRLPETIIDSNFTKTKPSVKNPKEDVAKLLRIPGLNAFTLWEKTAHAKPKMIKECWFGRNVTCDARGTWSLSLTTMGVCHTYTLNDSLIHLAGIFHNLYLKIQELEEDHYRSDEGWKFYIHNPLELPTLGVETHGTSLYPGQGRDLRLDLKKIWALHHSKNPCERNLAYLQNNCFFDCFMNRLHKENITCSLPYMIGSPLPYCSTPESYHNTEEIANNLFFFGQWNPNECQCKQQCLKTLFTSSLESTTDKYSAKKQVSRARVRIYYQNLQYEFIKETVGYGTIDLLCDIGGTLSLLMGASLLTCCELLEVAWMSLVSKCRPCRRQDKQPKEGTMDASQVHV
ncbi:acid-sensing ion channel 1-like [Tigriopus californicus]|nr:acid-sensing ion channel 1-like [Tigriopus californicus]